MGSLGSPVTVNTGASYFPPSAYWNHMPSHLTAVIPLSRAMWQCCENMSVEYTPNLARHRRYLIQTVTWGTLESRETKTVHVEVEGVSHYTTPLLCCTNAARFKAGPQSVMAFLGSTKWGLANDPELAGVYNREIHKLEQTGYTVKLTTKQANSTVLGYSSSHCKSQQS